MMTQLRVAFDGEVLRLERPVDLQPNMTYLVTIEREVAGDEVSGETTYPLTAMRRLATDMGVTDLSTDHDRYARGRLAGTGDDA